MTSTIITTNSVIPTMVMTPTKQNKKKKNENYDLASHNNANNNNIDNYYRKDIEDLDTNDLTKNLNYDDNNIYMKKL